MPSSQQRAGRDPSRPLGRLVRSLVLPCLGMLASVGAIYGALALPGALGAGDAGLYRASGLGERGVRLASLMPVPSRIAPLAPADCTEACSLAVARPAVPHQADEAKQGRVLLAALPSAERFAALDASSAAAQAKLAAAFRRAALKPAAAAKSARTVAKATLPASVLRRMQQTGPKPDSVPIVLAYAAAEQSRASRALDVFSAAPPTDPYLDDDDDTVLIVPDFEATPDEPPLPLRRPRLDSIEKPARPSKQVDRDDDDDAKPRSKRTVGEDRDDDGGAIVRTRPGDREPAGMTSPRAKLAYAKPDTPEPKGKDRGSWAMPRFFGGARAGGGVAVYDVSAARVYMPDGSVLEAHSGIGKMADNPKYEKVKMGGPTPVHTYNLKMREKRFHGVEAIRMLPVDGRNKHGRDGFLTHSYLLRGGRAESHGCVAFKDYNKFLNAYKQGKVKQLVVVPSGGRGAAVRMASAGRGA